MSETEVAMWQDPRIAVESVRFSVRHLSWPLGEVRLYLHHETADGRVFRAGAVLDRAEMDERTLFTAIEKLETLVGVEL